MLCVTADDALLLPCCSACWAAAAEESRDFHSGDSKGGHVASAGDGPGVGAAKREGSGDEGGAARDRATSSDEQERVVEPGSELQGLIIARHTAFGDDESFKSEEGADGSAPPARDGESPSCPQGGDGGRLSRKESFEKSRGSSSVSQAPGGGAAGLDLGGGQETRIGGGDAWPDDDTVSRTKLEKKEEGGFAPESPMPVDDELGGCKSQQARRPSSAAPSPSGGEPPSPPLSENLSLLDPPDVNSTASPASRHGGAAGRPTAEEPRNAADTSSFSDRVDGGGATAGGGEERGGTEALPPCSELLAALQSQGVDAKLLRALEARLTTVPRSSTSMPETPTKGATPTDTASGASAQPLLQLSTSDSDAYDDQAKEERNGFKSAALPSDSRTLQSPEASMSHYYTDQFSASSNDIRLRQPQQPSRQPWGPAAFSEGQRGTSDFTNDLRLLPAPPSITSSGHEATTGLGRPAGKIGGCLEVAR